jgi:hypothetical protein
MRVEEQSEEQDKENIALKVFFYYLRRILLINLLVFSIQKCKCLKPQIYNP